MNIQTVVLVGLGFIAVFGYLEPIGKRPSTPTPAFTTS